jgi:hypothetical protein
MAAVRWAVSKTSSLISIFRVPIRHFLRLQANNSAAHHHHQNKLSFRKHQPPLQIGQSVPDLFMLPFRQGASNSVNLVLAGDGLDVAVAQPDFCCDSIETVARSDGDHKEFWSQPGEVGVESLAVFRDLKDPQTAETDLSNEV